LASEPNSTGIAFEFLNDGFRLPGNTAIAGRGWIDATGVNDFLLTASPVPIPAAIWLFFSAVCGLGAMRQRAKAVE